MKPSSLIRPIMNAVANLSSSERVILDFLNSFVGEVFSLSQKELAKKTFTSEATVSRFVKKNKYTSYKQFTIEFNIALKEMNDRFKVLGSKDGGGLLQNMLTSHKFGIESTMSSDNLQKLEQSVPKILSAKRIVTFGRGSSKVAAANLQKNLVRLRLNAQNLTSFHDFLPILGGSNQDDVFILFSNLFKSKEVIFAIEELRATGAFVIVITSNNSKAYDAFVNLKVVYKKIHNDKFYVPIASKISQIILCDLLFELILQSDPKFKDILKNSMTIFHKWELHH